MNKIKVIIADDHKLIREGIISLICKFNIVKSVAEVSEGRELIDMINVEKPDLILMDLQMPVLNGIEATIHIKTKWPSIKIIILTFHSENKFIIHMIQNGVDGYLAKNTNSIELEKAIKSVMQGNFYGDRGVNEAILAEVKYPRNNIPSFKTDIDLNKRELQTLMLMSEGLTNFEIAEKLYLSKRTVEGYRNNLLYKLEVRNSIELIVKAIKLGLIVIT